MTEEAVTLKIHIDGCSKGNPGLAAYGVVVEDDEGTTLAELGEIVGRNTSNVAEYRGLHAALDYILQFPVKKRVMIYSDSQLLVNQIHGTYRVRSPKLKNLHFAAINKLDKLAHWTIQHIPRTENSRADKLANDAVKRFRASLKEKQRDPGKKTKKRGPDSD